MYGEPEAATMTLHPARTLGTQDFIIRRTPPARASTPSGGGGGGAAAAAADLSNPRPRIRHHLLRDTWFASEVSVAFDPLLPLLRHVGGFDILYDNAMVIPRMVQVRGHSARMQAGQAFSATLMMVNHPQLLCGTSLYERCKSAVRSVGGAGAGTTTIERRPCPTAASFSGGRQYASHGFYAGV